MTEEEIEKRIKMGISAEMTRLRRKRMLFWGFAAIFVPLTLWAAAIVKPHSFNDGDTLSATKLNENFDTLFAKVNELSTRIGKFCGETAATYDGLAVGGLIGARAKCNTACGHSDAHMCTSHELSIEFQKGVAIPSNLWYSSMVESRDGTAQWTDCESWTTNATSVRAGAITQSNGRPSYGICDSAYKIACCL